jgi:hypothetical protein
MANLSFEGTNNKIRFYAESNRGWKSNRINLIMSEADVDTSTFVFGVLSGLTFTASVFIFSFHNSMPYGDLYLILTLISTVLFVFATVLTSVAADDLGKAQMQKILKRAAIIGGMRFFMLLTDIASIAFCTGLIIGIIVVLVTVVVLVKCNLVN